MRIIKRSTGTGTSGPGLAFTTEPAGGAATTPLAPAPVVKLATGSTVVPGFTGSVTAALQNNPDGAVLGGTTTVNAVAGVATFTNLTVSKDTALITLKASATGLLDAFSTSFDIITPPTSFWWSTSRDQRLGVSVANDSGFDLHDHLLPVTLPGGVSPDANSLRAVETTTTGTVDRAFDWRYGTVQNVNRLIDLPVSLSGGVASLLVPGRWPAGQTRRFALYWASGGGISAYDWSYLDALDSAWTDTVVLGATNDHYKLTIAGVTVDYQQVAGDTTATLLANHLAAAINAQASAVAGTATNSGAIVSIKAKTPRTQLTFTVAVDGTSTTPANQTVKKPIYWSAGRSGPDTDQFAAATYGFGHPYGLGTTIALRVGWGRATAVSDNQMLRLMSYRTNTDGTTDFFANDGTISSITRNGPTQDVAGALTFSTRSAGTDWSGAYTARQQHRFRRGRKSDSVPYSAAVTAGTAGDVYAIVVNGTTYSYTMAGGNTAQVIADALVTAVNAGTRAQAADNAGTSTSVSIFPYGNGTAGNVVTNTGTTVPANLVVTASATADTLLKSVDTLRVSLTYTCTRAYTPKTASSAITAADFNTILLTLATNQNNFTANVTEHADNKIAAFSADATTGKITSYGASADLSALSVSGGSILGVSGNTNGWGVLVNSVTLSGWTGQTPVAHWAGTSGALAQLQVVGTTSGATIPVGATATIDLWLISAYTPNGTTVGDNLLPDEIVKLLRSIAATPTQAVDTTATTLYSASQDLANSIAAASATLQTAVTTWQAGALADTTVAWNYAYQKNVITGVIGPDDDDDGSYSQALLLAGLCLKYLRTHDAALVPLIENQVKFHLNIEALAVSLWGSWWSGAVPYWVWPTTATQTYPSEGGIQEASGSTGVDPGFGVALGSITYGTGAYPRGTPRRKTSIDQINMVTAGLGWHYLWLLRNEAAITGTATTFGGVNLYQAALNLLGRMKVFEATYYSAGNRVVDNLYNLLTSVTRTNANGIDDTHLNVALGTALASPRFWGNTYNAWKVLNGTGQQDNPSSNTAIINYFRALYATNSTQTGVTHWMQGQTNDMLTSDMSRSDVVAGANVAGMGVLGAYRAGWSMRPAVTLITTVYEATRTTPSTNNQFPTELHYISMNDGGARDHFSPRAAQRAAVLCFAALLDPTYAIALENTGTTVNRSVNILTALDDQMRTLAVLSTEPTTGMQRIAVSGYLGKTSQYDPQLVDATFTGYWAWALELWLLVQRRVGGTFDPATYYGWSGV